MSTVEERAEAAAKLSTPETAYRDYQRFVAQEMAQYEWDNRFLPYRIVDRLLGRRKPR